MDVPRALTYPCTEYTPEFTYPEADELHVSELVMAALVNVPRPLAAELDSTRVFLALKVREHILKTDATDYVRSTKTRALSRDNEIPIT